jgi:hypothetical protein
LRGKDNLLSKLFRIKPMEYKAEIKNLRNRKVFPKAKRGTQ